MTDDRPKRGSLEPAMRRFAVSQVWASCKYLQAHLERQYGCSEITQEDIPELFSGNPPSEEYNHPVEHGYAGLARAAMVGMRELLGGLIDDMGEDPAAPLDPNPGIRSGTPSNPRIIGGVRTPPEDGDA